MLLEQVDWQPSPLYLRRADEWSGHNDPEHEQIGGFDLDTQQNQKLYLEGNHIYEIQIENKTIFKSLGYDYSNDVGGKNYLFTDNNLKIDLSKYFQNSKIINLVLTLRNYHPYKQPAIKYSNEDLLNKLNWEIRYKNNTIDHIEEINDNNIYIRSNLEIENKFIDNKLIFFLFQIFILVFFVLFWKRNLN